MTQQEFQAIASTLPSEAGIYKYYDAADQLLYVGKAKNIRKRVASYFLKNLTNYKTHELVRRISRIDFTIVNSEQDAFFLENSLIKNFQPMFNINLKDDKSYPYIIIKNEPFPRVFLTRRVIEDGSQYLGPFTSVHKVRELLNFIKQSIQLRTCSLNLSRNNIEKKKFKVCLEYHLGNCKGPCEGLQSEQDYANGLDQLKNLLKGNLSPVIQHFRNEMKGEVQDLKFEKAELIRKKIDFLENYQGKSVVISTRTNDLDVFYITKEEDDIFINYLMVQNGTIVQTETVQPEAHLDESLQEILAYSIGMLRTTFKSNAREIILPFPVEYSEPGAIITVPKGGDKKKLLELSEKNAYYFIDQIRAKKRLQLGIKQEETMTMLEQLQDDLKLPELPVNIECFDNSNFQGSYPVSAMVSFRNGVPDKKNYRHFNVRTVEGINDFATMKEAVSRRYTRVIEEKLEWPQLVIIDGGKGQLGAAHEALVELNADGMTTVIGLAKNEEEIFFPGDMESLKLPFNGQSLKLIRRIRNEVHRFGINFHRLKRSKGTFTNELEGIKGIGRHTATILLKEFRSVKNIKEQTEESIARIIGKKKAELVVRHFAQQSDNEPLTKKMGPG